MQNLESTPAIPGRLQRIPIPGCRGLVYQLTGTGIASWVLKTRLGKDGSHISLTIGRVSEVRRADAEEEAHRLLALCRKGVDPRKIEAPKSPEIRIAPSLDTAWAEYERVYLPLKSARYAAYQTWAYQKYIQPELGGMALDTIGTSKVDTFLESLDRIPTTANRVHALLSKHFNWASRRYTCVLSNPVMGREKHRETGRERRLSVSELQAFGQAWRLSNNPLRYAVLFLLLTGSRAGVITNFDPAWQRDNYLDIPAGTPGLKGCRYVVTPFISRTLLYRIQRTTLPALYHCLISMCENANIKDFTLHDLRRSFASFGADLGESDYLVDGILSHSRGRGRVTEIYMRRSIPALLDVSERVSLHIWGIVSFTEGAFLNEKLRMG
jgi:integrase